MSKNHRENRKPAYADWTVHFADPMPGPAAVITRAVFARDEHGGYTFTDARGIAADFVPCVVSHVIRKDAEAETGPWLTSLGKVGPIAPVPVDAEAEVLDSRA